jgi:ubiquitin-protein ligase
LVPEQIAPVHELLDDVRINYNKFLKKKFDAGKFPESETKTFNKFSNLWMSISKKIVILRLKNEKRNNSDENMEMLQEVGKSRAERKYKLLMTDQLYTKTDAWIERHTKIRDHIHNAVISKMTGTSSMNRSVRINNELARLKKELLIDITHTIIIREDLERQDVIKFLIFGAEGTPYSSGAFVYNLFMGNDFPENPPKCRIETTGGGQVRFNTNLYSDGLVCLSLLGTWRGRSQAENWNSCTSNIYQLVISILALVMTEEVLANEPGVNGRTSENLLKDIGYCNIIKYANIKYAMIDQLRNPTPGFEDAIRRHFWVKKQRILTEVAGWIADAKRPANYTGLVEQHNSSLAAKFKKTTNAYLDAL